MSAAARPEPTFTQFITSLRQRFGESALDVRRKAFFLTLGRRPAFIGVHATAALLRDAWQLCRGPARAAPPARPLVLLATLAGGNGWGTLGGTAAVILRHDDFDLMSRAALGPGAGALVARELHGTVGWFGGPAVPGIRQGA